MGSLILLTGATGFLGSRIARLLLQDPDKRLVLLVRGADQEGARRALLRAWSGVKGLEGALLSRARVLRGDLTLPSLGLGEADYAELVGSLTHIVHAAAELRLDAELEAMRCVNVEGVSRLIDLARRVHADHGLERFAHVSTAYVSGLRTGQIAEDELSGEAGFSNTYERSKFEGESLVRKAMPDLPVSIFRPGMVVGDSLSGDISTFNTVYVPLRLYLAGKLKALPSRPDLRLNIVPVDYVADCIARLSFDARARGLCFHLTLAEHHCPRAAEVLDLARRWAIEHLGTDPGPARFVPLAAGLGARAARAFGLPAALLPYFSETHSYRRDNVDRLSGPYAPDWERILPRLLAYATERGFLRTSGRTVHEQFVRRLLSSRLPLRIHDLAEGRAPKMRGARELYAEIGKAVGALKALGLKKGDRVALVGLNSSRFLSLDIAIGLAGAVSVPLYYTAPIPEIDAVLSASGAQLLLIGAPEILARAGELNTRIPIASFCADEPESTEGRVRSWESFLNLGAALDGSALPGVSGPKAPVDFSDLATIRYSSGTTGEPKGYCFHHAQLCWLARTLASLMPWKARSRRARYLSFLPMNHVVEGILGTYAPAYISAPVDIYFLKDFHSLAHFLPRVRPTVFFSVPRFYEKLWDRFTRSPLARLYLSLRSGGVPGALRKVLRLLLRRGLLRKAGLDRCAQLISGSAPCRDELLEHFREIGMEIHNAYGLTEAPLVTMNRQGANRLGTVGLPLPETCVRLAGDGEVLVSGPQVSTRAFGEPAGSLLDEGWLRTGDLGDFDDEGRLRLRGRKKEILITSYGKNIHPLKIEGMLRGIPGLLEAMVIGDARPSLSALLWLKEAGAGPETLEAIDRQVRIVNGELSRPERLRRWAILAEHPAMDSGELTGNLKLRRHRVLERRADVVRLLYGEAGSGAREASGEGIPGLLHVGEALSA